MTQTHQVSEGPDAHCVRNNAILGMLALAVALLTIILSIIDSIRWGKATGISLGVWMISAGWIFLGTFGGQRMVQGAASPKIVIQAVQLIRLNMVFFVPVLALTLIRLLVYAVFHV